MMNGCGGKSRLPKRPDGGFTLIEIIIVVIIVGILAMVALPAYQDSVRKGQRSDAKVGLLAAAGRMEQFILDRGTYTDDMTDLGYATDPMVSEEQHYDISAEACEDGDLTTCFVLTATPRSTSPLADDAGCTAFTLANTGAREAKGTHKDECWN
ncbi:MAG: prepilin-type N-terminal cleavage/methylation domain-containing protein [Haliea sp.]|nr:prepilin-type N-terminal cleavage/methylation domain-containing protein [Haliea sp.]